MYREENGTTHFNSMYKERNSTTHFNSMYREKNGTTQFYILCTGRGTVQHNYIFYVQDGERYNTILYSMYREGNGTKHFKDCAVYMGQYKQVNINNYENLK